MSLSLGSHPTPHAQPLIDALQQAVDNAGLRKDAALTVAFSGGLDSASLLSCAFHLWPDRVSALHIDHGLQASSADWARQYHDWCAEAGIPFTSVTLDLSHVEQNIEAEARAARYAVFREHLQAGQGLLMAHHQDDQQELLLLRLFRGSGIDGMAGMPGQRALGSGLLIRPWLNFSRSELEAFAQAAGLPWIEDPTNQDTRFDRNFLRQDILPRLRERWPGLEQTLGRSQRHLQEASLRLQDLDQQTLNAWQQRGPGLPIALLEDPVAGLSRLRLWLQAAEVGQVSESQLQHIRHDVAQASADAQGSVRLGEHEVRRFHGRLYVVTDRPPLPDAPMEWADPEQPFSHPAWGELFMQPGETSAELPALDPARLSKHTLSLRVRQGGEYGHPVGRAGGRDLKRLLQEARVPPWWRSHVPLLYADDELVAVANLHVMAGWEAPVGATGWQLRWTVDGQQPW